MLDQWVRGAATVLGVTALLSLPLFVMGLAVRAALGRRVHLAASAGLTVGLGAVPATLAVATARALHLDVRPAPFVALGAGVVALTVAAIVARRHGLGTGWDWLRAQGPTRFDCVALAASLLALAPVIVQGLTFWTAYVNDFPSYAASVQVWLSGPDSSSWLHAHPDAFGAYQLDRAEFEKPMCTAFLVAASLFTGTPSYLLLAPATIVGVVVLVATLFALVRAVVPPRLPVYGVVLAPALSVLPMSRIFDAQLGQGIAAAMVVVSVAAMLGRTDDRRSRSDAILGVVVGATTAATLGMNVTLILGTAPTIVAVTAWLLVKGRIPWRSTLIRFATGIPTALAFSLPFAKGYAHSFGMQSSGDVGYGIPLASPLSLIGLQTTIQAVLTHTQAAVEWGALLGIATIAYVGSRHRHSGVPASGLLAIVTLLNGLIILAVHGSDSYTLHKWLAFVIPLVVPLLLCMTIALMPDTTWRTVGVATTAVAALAISLTAQTARAVHAVVPDAIWSLSSPDTCPPDTPVINIDTGSIYEDSIAPLVTCAPVSIVVGTTYAEGSTPMGNAVLTRDGATDLWKPSSVTALAAPYALAVADLTLTPDTTIAFSSSEPADRRYLFGSWTDFDPEGVWSTGSNSAIAFDVPKEMRSQGVELTLTGARAAAAAAPRDVVVKVDGATVASATFAAPVAPRSISFSIGPSMIHDGRVVLELETPDPIRPADYGQPDSRTLAYYLQDIRLSAITD